MVTTQTLHRYNSDPESSGEFDSWWAHLDSNQGPTGYEPVALAN